MAGSGTEGSAGSRDRGRRAGAWGGGLALALGAGLISAAPLSGAVASQAEQAPRQQGGAAEFRSRDGAQEDLASLIEHLDSPDFMTRQEASAGIITDGRITIAMIEEALERDDLSPEQRQRLRHVQKQRFETTDRAGMGVGFAQQLLPHRVVLDRTIEPFKSTELLEPGDIILRADGIDLRSARALEMVRMVIISHDPGDEVDLVVARGEERLNIRVPLGRYSDLRNTNSLDPGDLELAWRMRQTRTPDPGRAAIATGLTMEEWREMERASELRQRERNNAAARAGMNTTPPRLLIAGGKPIPPYIEDADLLKLNFVRSKNELNNEELQLLRMQDELNGRARAMFEGEPMTLESELDRVAAVAEISRQEALQLDAAAKAGRPVDPAALERNRHDLLVTERVLRALLAEQRDAGTQAPK